MLGQQKSTWMMTSGAIVLGCYRVEDMIAFGGQATVARGIDLRAGVAVAIKRLNAQSGGPGFDEALARFQREGSLRINHPLVVDPIAFGEEDGYWYIIYPFVQGVELDVYIQRAGGKLSWQQAVAITTDLAEALSAIHRRGLVHRDIKPNNIIIAQDSRPRIVDLGISKDLNQVTVAQKNGFIGTYGSSSPEQIQNGHIDCRSDLYSLSVVLYGMLTGCPTVQGSTEIEVARSVCHDLPTAPSQLDTSIPPHVSVACMRALEKRPENRYASADEFAKALADTGFSASQCGACWKSLPDSGVFCPHCGVRRGAACPERIHCLACGCWVGGEMACPSCSRPFSAHDHRLYFRSGATAGKIFRVAEGNYEVGRGILAPDDNCISRRQLEVHCMNGTVAIQNLGSTNQTLINGLPLFQKTVLVPGVAIAIAGNEGSFSSH